MLSMNSYAIFVISTSGIKKNELTSRMEAIAHPSYMLALHIPIMWLSEVKCVSRQFFYCLDYVINDLYHKQ